MRNTQSKEYVTLKEGDPLEGWTLEKVQQRRIVFNSGQQESIVELDVYTGPAGQGRTRGGASAQDGSNGGEQQSDGAQVIDSADMRFQRRPGHPRPHRAGTRAAQATHRRSAQAPAANG